MFDIVSSPSAPKAIGPYSQAIIAGPFVFCSGQIPLDPVSGTVIAGGIAEQTARVLDNLKAVLAGAQTSLAHVVKTTVYLKDIAEFQAMNEVYGKYFAERCPARATVEVARLPKDVKVEIDCIAYTG